MEKLTFECLQLLCKLNVDKKHVANCLQLLQNGDCIFDSGIIMPHKHIAAIYSLRFDIAKKGGKLTEQFLNDYGNCVDELKNSKSQYLGITTVWSDDQSLLIFYGVDTNDILGVLKFENYSGIEGIEDAQTDTVKRGFTSNAEKYSKGKLVRRWD